KEMKIRALDIAITFKFLMPHTTLVLHPQNEGRQYMDASQLTKVGLGTRVPSQDMQLLSPEDFKKTLPDTLANRVKISRRVVSFVDNDPHFVVWPSGMKTPLCFDLHGNEGDVLSLVRDHKSGILVNGQVTGSVSRPGNTYFTTLHITLGNVSLIITPHHVTRDCPPDNHHHRRHHAGWLGSSIWPFNKKRGRHRAQRKHHIRKALQLRRQAHRRLDRETRTKRSLQTSHHVKPMIFNRRLRSFPHQNRKKVSQRGKITRSSTVDENPLKLDQMRHKQREKMRENMMKIRASLDDILSEIRNRKHPILKNNSNSSLSSN
ncbi:unnamed protein product, partial [Meganyctiphanes norvegica]